MNKYFVQVSRDGDPTIISYKVRASTSLDARIIAFAMDRGFPDNQTNLERGDIELVKMWTKVTVEVKVPSRADKLEERIHKLEERVNDIEIVFRNIPSWPQITNHPQIIDTNEVSAPETPSRDCRPCRPNPISYRLGE